MKDLQRSSVEINTEFPYNSINKANICAIKMKLRNINLPKAIEKSKNSPNSFQKTENRVYPNKAFSFVEETLTEKTATREVGQI